MAAMTRKRAIPRWNIGIYTSSVLLLLLQQEYILHLQEIKKPRGFGIN